MKIVAAPDKFRGSATATEIAAAIGRAAWDCGHDCVEVPMADGGEGTLEAFGGPNQSSTVTGPLGRPVDAEWRLDGRVAVIEMAAASGLALAGGAEGNDPLAATTRGTGELIRIAVERGSRRVIVGLGGSATTDGGLGAVEALHRARLRGIDLVVGCDVDTTFVEAATMFGPQKGATAAQVELLRRRLERLADVYRADYEIDVTDLAGAGAAGGLAGGLAAVGAQLEPGFELIATEVELYDHIAEADLVVTGEGRLDHSSFSGKVVGGVAGLCAELDVPCLAVVGQVEADLDPGSIEVLALTGTRPGPGAVDGAPAPARVVEDLLRTRWRDQYRAG